MSYQKLFRLKNNPFRIIPATKSEEIIWAGFPELKAKFEKIIKRSLRIPNSGLIINWGEFGSGKTHAARYFNKHKTLESIAKSEKCAIPFSISFVLPKGKDPVYDMHVSIIDKLDITQLRELFKSHNESIIDFIDNIIDNLHIKSVLKAVFSDADVNTLKKYLYGNLTNTELKSLNNYNILRHFSSDSDYTKFLSGLFSCLTFEKRVFSSVIIWIDEFEDIAILNSVNIDKTNNFIRELFDNTPNNLLLFINLTQTALVNITDLGQYINDAVTSRIKDRINFEIPNNETIVNYLKELLNNELFRKSPEDDELFPFSKEVVEEILKDFGNGTLRQFNEAFSLLLEIAEYENKTPIDIDFYNDNKQEIIGWKK
jgi:hypothetical protein